MLNMLKKIAKLATVLIIGLYISVWILSPFLTHYFLSQYLKTQQLELAAESTIRFNPFLSRLTIEELALSKVGDHSGKVFKISELTIELAIHRLLSEQVSISEFIIDGLYITINKDDKLLDVAGINIPLGRQIDSGKSTVTAAESIEQELNKPFQLVMSKMKLMNSTVDIIEKGQLHQLHLSEVNINEVKATELKQDLSVTVIADLDGAEIILSAVANMKDGFGEINFEAELSDIDIKKFSHFSAPYVDQIAGLVSYHGSHKIELSEEGITVGISDLALTGQHLAANKNDLHLTSGQQSFKSDYLSIQALAGAQLEITTVGELLLQDINIYNKTKSQVLISTEELLLDSIGINSELGGYQLTVNNLAVLGSLLSDNFENKTPALTQFEALNIHDIVLTEKSLIVDTIEFSGLRGNAQLDKNKALKNLIISKNELLSAVENSKSNLDQAPDDAVSNDAVSNEKIFSIKLNSITLADNAEIQFLDSSISPSYERSLVITHLLAGPFDNLLPDQDSIIKITGSSNEYASFDINVKAKPFLADPSYDMKGQFSEINLPGISAYVKESLGYTIDSGQLDLGITAQLVGTKIDGEANVLLRGVNLTAVDEAESENEAESESSGSQTSIPFSVALSMLKDDDGNVELDLPLSGDTSSPSFGLSGLLKVLITKATIIGTREYLAQVLIPYAGLVTMVVVADKHILKMEIKNLEYSAESIDVPTEHEVFLSDFVALMKDNSDLHIKLCGVASATDIGKESGSDISSKEDADALRTISEQRAKRFKAYMVDEHEVDSSRLLLCAPQIDSDETAIPHLRFET